MNWMPFLWLAATLGALFLIERWIHRHLQGVMLLLTGNPDMALVLYALPLLPGIVIHELSHALAAILLGVRVGSISVRPKLAGQRIQLGFVPVERTDVVRASLIGLAPLLVGCGVILLIGYTVFGLAAMGAAIAGGDWANTLASLVGLRGATDAWIWAYAIFAVSNTMLPSRADRQAWTPLILFLALLAIVLCIVGLRSTAIASVSSLVVTPLTIALHWLATMCTLTLAIDLPFVLLIALAERLLERVRGCKVEYRA